jgi:RNA polymerase sigma factor (sigma-70 family)
MKFQDDSFYIERILNGDVSAYASLVAKHKNLVFSIVIKILNNREDAEEVAQDVFLKVYHSLKTFERKSKFSTWLYRIAYNAAITKTRKKKMIFIPIEETSVSNYMEDEVHPSGDPGERDDRQVWLEKALNKLPEGDQLLITLFYKSENSVEDISYITGLTASNVKVRLHRIRRKLYDEIQELATKQQN